MYRLDRIKVIASASSKASIEPTPASRPNFSPSDAQRTYDGRGMNVSIHLEPDETREGVEISA